jgi:hypothetical protein
LCFHVNAQKVSDFGACWIVDFQIRDAPPVFKICLSRRMNMVEILCILYENETKRPVETLPRVRGGG